MKPLSLSVFFFLLLSTLDAQRLEIGIMRGAAIYSGDISNSNLKSSFGINGRFFITENVALRSGIVLANVSAGEDPQFSSPIFEANLLGEYHLSHHPDSRFSTYFFGGLAFFHFNPQAKIGDTWTDLQPLSTLGKETAAEGEYYRLWQVALPFGGGIRYYLSPRMALGLEVGARKTFTDYLDNVGGNTGSNNGKDWYFIGGLTLAYQLF